MPKDTRRLFDITGAENVMLFVAAPGDEIAICGGLIAEACARGRPPFVAILGDGAPDGSAALARSREQGSRAATALLGLPPARLLFVGLRQGAFPADSDPVYRALVAAMTLLSWRQDCNVIAAPFGADAGDRAVTARLARDVAARDGLKLVACAPPPAAAVWRLDLAGWRTLTSRALALCGAVGPSPDPDWELFQTT